MARDIQFEIDPATGELSVEFFGIQGPMCEQTQAQIESFFGTPSTDVRKQEYYQVPVKTTQKVGKQR